MGTFTIFVRLAKIEFGETGVSEMGVGETVPPHPMA